jgi:hypothetical protein
MILFLSIDSTNEPIVLDNLFSLAAQRAAIIVLKVQFWKSCPEVQLLISLIPSLGFKAQDKLEGVV